MLYSSWLGAVRGGGFAGLCQTEARSRREAGVSSCWVRVIGIWAARRSTGIAVAHAWKRWSHLLLCSRTQSGNRARPAGEVQPRDLGAKHSTASGARSSLENSDLQCPFPVCTEDALLAALRTRREANSHSAFVQSPSLRTAPKSPRGLHLANYFDQSVPKAPMYINARHESPIRRHPQMRASAASAVTAVPRGAAKRLARGLRAAT